VRTVIADTSDPAVLVAADAGAAVGTEFSSRSFPGGAPEAGRLWRAFHTPPVGTLSCGAAGLLAVEHRQPLRRIDVISARGAFRAGDVVNITGPDARLLARGSVRYPAGTVEFGCTPDTELLVSSDYVQIRED
jgi:glutamate 5-kinase